MVEIVKGDKHYVFLIKDILTISMGRDKEENEASLQIKLANDNYCIEFSGSNNAITKLYISINMQWQLFRNKNARGYFEMDGANTYYLCINLYPCGRCK